ncbi:hypothetical protein NDU88_006462 [Pleurodeles waltl]|uniref:Uncharacterized protein n=1 Tax=Pleurodeles waltl TaxID=8319 RepID=A0AAV7TDN5_PLEWA|nr:hypothetical protein NDU88_006462 [Pleurodeles waltl]
MVQVVAARWEKERPPVLVFLMQGTFARESWAEHRVLWECVAVVQSTCDEGMCDALSMLKGDPFESLVKETDGVEVGGGDCIDLMVHAEVGVQNDSEVAGLDGWGGWVSECESPPGVAPCVELGAQDEYLGLVCVELKAAISHPAGNYFHAFVEIVSGLFWFVGEVEDEVGVVGIGEEVHYVASDASG